MKLIVTFIVVLVGGLCVATKTSFAAYGRPNNPGTTLTIVYNDSDKSFYYPEGYLFEDNRFLIPDTYVPYRDGSEKEPLEFDVYYNTIIIDYAGADEFHYPFVFLLNDEWNTDKKYVKYMIEEKKKEKKLVFEVIYRSSKIQMDSVTPDSETAEYSYMHPGAGLFDEGLKSGYTPPMFSIDSNILVHCKETANMWNIFFAGDYYWQFQQRLGNSKIQTSTTANVATYPSVFTFCVTDFGNEKNEGAKIETSDIFKFSEGQKKDKTAVTIREKKGGAVIDVLNPVVALVKLVTGTYGFTPASYQISGDQGLTSSRNDIDFSDGATGKRKHIIYAFAYTFHGSNSGGMDGEANAVEKTVSKLLIAIGSVFRVSLAAMEGGDNLSIDALIFNEYKYTKIDFFNPDPEEYYKGFYTDDLSTAINKWYDAFKVIALIVILMLLPAIAIKVMLYAGTPNQTKISGMISGWIMAIILLFFGPYMMKYIIELNNSAVKIFRDNSKYSIYSVYNKDYFENHEWAQEFQVGEDSEADFAAWLKENINKKQQQWLDASSKLGMLDDSMVDNSYAAQNIFQKAIQFFVDIFNWIKGLLEKIGKSIAESINEQIKFKCTVTNIQVPSGLNATNDGIEWEEMNVSFNTNRDTAIDVIDQLGKSKRLGMSGDGKNCTATIDNVQICGVNVDKLVAKINEWFGWALNAIGEFITYITETLEKVKQEVAAALEGIESTFKKVVNDVKEFFYPGSGDEYNQKVSEQNQKQALAQSEYNKNKAIADDVKNELETKRYVNSKRLI